VLGRAAHVPKPGHGEPRFVKCEKNNLSELLILATKTGRGSGLSMEIATAASTTGLQVNSENRDYLC